MERLFENFKPENYQIELRINKEIEKVQGHVIITGEKIKQPLKLHAKNLKITSLLVNGAAKKFSESANDLEIFDVENGAIKIDIKYTFDLARNMEGVYLSTYKYKGVEERIVSTQFESHYAREGFPCVDEPEAKATFDLKIIDTDATDEILGNMPKKRERVLEYVSVDPDESPAGGVSLSKTVRRKIVEFETTPRMSTYLLAFVIGHFNKVTFKNKHGVEVSTYAALNQSKKMLDFPNKVAADALDFYDDLFGTPYPLPKLDQVAIPDFEAGAMENWGLVTYREACLLMSEDTPKAHNEYVSTVITHELSHQWFGDLVTMKWWDNLWLNESFANMMQYYCVDHLYPDWKIWQDFFTDDCLAALSRDALPGVQSVQQEVKNPEEIATLFDASIVYAKGARLMFMLMRLMGEKSFFAGLKDYFKKYKYRNTTGDDLWQALQPHAKFDIKEFMDAWIMQPGYPMLTDGNQQRFLLNGETDDTKWPLPKITDDMSGHYLINLSAQEFAEKIEKFDTLNLEQKLRLLIDRHLLSRTPIVSTGTLMDLIPKFKDEESETIFGIVAGIMNTLKYFAAPDTEYYPKLQHYIYNMVENNLRRLGFSTRAHDDANDIKMRELMLGFALYADDAETIKTLADFYHDDIKKIDSEILGSVLEAKFKRDDEADFDRFLELYRDESEPTIKSELLSCLTDAKKPENIEKLMKLLEQPEIVRPGDHIYLYADLLTNFWTRERAFEWCYANWEYIKSLTSDKSMEDYVRVTAACVRTREQAERFFWFFDQMKEDPVLKRSIEVAHVDIEAKLKWIESDAAEVHERLMNI
jgi:aminopeptidase N